MKLSLENYKIVYLFPFDNIPKDSRIVLYGAGTVGKQFYEQITETRFCKIVLWLDKKADGVLVKQPETIASLNVSDYDLVIIAIENKTIMLEVKALLMNYGVPENKIIHRITIKTIKPDTVRIDASTLCQLNCKLCYMRKYNSGTVGKGYLKFSDFKNFVDRNNYIRKIELSNSGEIFLNPDLIHIIKYAYENNIELTATTGVNFNTVSNEVIEALVKYNFRSMAISIDGASPEIYPIYRINGNFDTVINNIKKLNSYKHKYKSEYPELYWQYIIMEHNETDVIKAKTMAEELGMKIYFRTTWDGDYVPKNITMLKKETGLKFLTRKELLEANRNAHNWCSMLWNAPQINWDGRLLGCCCVYTDDFGVNVFEIGLEEALNSENYIIAKKILMGKIDIPENTKNIPCASCNQRHNFSPKVQ